MGLISNALALLPEVKTAIGAAIPTWNSGMPQSPMDGTRYEQFARQGYMLDEIVFGCIEVRATSAAEPKICAFENKDEKVEDHTALALLERPNPFLDGMTFWATIMMYLDIAGNAYVEKVRNRLGNVVQLWLLRPDRVHIIPDAVKHIGGYRYSIGSQEWTLPPEDVIQFKTRHPLDDFYGLSPLHVLAPRIDLDVWARQFTQAFFKNAGVPAGLLSIKRAVSLQEREMIRQRWRTQYGGPEGWHNVMVMDDMESTYTPMGLPLGGRGAAMPELNEINETRICAVLQVQPSLVPSMAGMHSSSYANRVSDKEFLWDSTLAPIYRYLAVTLTNGLQPEFPDLDHFEFDLTKVRALQEDEDKKHARHREDWQAGVITRREFRVACGYPPEPDEAGTYLIPIRAIETPSDEMVTVAQSGTEAGLPAEATATGAQPGQSTGQQQPAALAAATPKGGKA
jgi:HK97 family phage portal protein